MTVHNLARHPASIDAPSTGEDLEMFTYAMAHDLKGPLFTISALGECLLEDLSASIDDRSREYLVRLVDASRYMGQLVDDLMDMARVSRLSLDREEVDLVRAIETITETELRGSIERRGAIILVEDGLPSVAADGARIRQVFRNLIDNAIKFNASLQPVVEIGCEDSDGRIAHLFVRDNGIGMAEQEQLRAFQLFERVHLADDYSGTGAGLALAKRAVEAFDGTIWLESVAGNGCTVHFTLPVWSGAMMAEDAERPTGPSRQVA